MRKSGRNLIGTQVEPTCHQFNFEEYEYSLSPMDWCTGKDASSAYSTLLRYGTGNDDALPIYTVTRSAKHPYKDETLTYSMSAIDVVDIYPINHFYTFLPIKYVLVISCFSDLHCSCVSKNCNLKSLGHGSEPLPSRGNLPSGQALAAYLAVGVDWTRPYSHKP